jgi:hypothetical protein
MCYLFHRLIFYYNCCPYGELPSDSHCLRLASIDTLYTYYTVQMLERSQPEIVKMDLLVSPCPYVRPSRRST